MESSIIPLIGAFIYLVYVQGFKSAAADVKTTVVGVTKIANEDIRKVKLPTFNEASEFTAKLVVESQEALSEDIARVQSKKVVKNRTKFEATMMDPKSAWLLKNVA